MNRIDRPQPKLLFSTPEFVPPGVVQTTVRVGAKWRDDLKGTVQPRIPCFETGKESEGSIGEATVVGTLFGSFKDFGYVGSVINHQENCRELDGLAEELAKFYPDFDPETSQITVIFFKYTPNQTEEESDDSEDSEKEGE
jgi:hypothetical protein